MRKPAQPFGPGEIPCPYCGAPCDPSAVGDHDLDCEGYGENGRWALTPDDPPE